MPLIVSIIIPIFGLIGVGYGAARWRILPSAAADGLSSFVFVVAMPVLLFRTIATADFGSTSPLLLWLTYFSGVAVVYAAGMLVARKLAGADRRSGVIAGVAASFSNLVLVAVPVVERALGREGLDILSLLLAVHLPVMAGAATLMMERAAYLDAREVGPDATADFKVGPVLRRIVRSLSRNPLILGIVAGLLFRFSGLPLTGPLAEIVDALATTSGPLALVTLGLSLTKYGIGGDFRAPSLIAILALLVQPAVVLALGSVLLPPLWVAVAVLGAACPSGVNSYLFALHFKIDERLSATVIVMTTVLSAATLIGWLTLIAP